WPFADKAIERLADRVKGIIVAELNYGQLVNEVRRAVAGRADVALCGKYNMKAFEPEEIEAAINAMMKGGKA
ncbi:MAG: 2-oxoacid:acceptor oxidoreductase subunit alpha, partial [Selenomonadaceae bacterium]|nr:2-oxoacid:acceptor oxidoreductase subunit alpha [Selenomonadaceae bacterium]